MAGRNFANDFERSGRRRNIAGAHRIAVHGGDCGWRLRAQRGHVFGEHAAARIDRAAQFRTGSGLALEQDEPKRFGDRHQGHDTPSPRAFHSPDLPPLLCRRRMPSMRMPRSTALTMS